MPRLFVSYVTHHPERPIEFGNMVLDHDVPRSDMDISFLQLKIHNKIPEEKRPIAQPTILWFHVLPDMLPD